MFICLSSCHFTSNIFFKKFLNKMNIKFLQEVSRKIKSENKTSFEKWISAKYSIEKYNEIKFESKQI